MSCYCQALAVFVPDLSSAKLPWMELHLVELTSPDPAQKQQISHNVDVWTLCVIHIFTSYFCSWISRSLFPLVIHSIKEVLKNVPLFCSQYSLPRWCSLLWQFSIKLNRTVFFCKKNIIRIVSSSLWSNDSVSETGNIDIFKNYSYQCWYFLIFH